MSSTCPSVLRAELRTIENKQLPQVVDPYAQMAVFFPALAWLWHVLSALLCSALPCLLCAAMHALPFAQRCCRAREAYLPHGTL